VNKGIAMQIVYIPINRFTTPNGKPTCFTHAETAACVFMRLGGPRNQAYCKSPIAGVADQLLDAKNGYVQPHGKCVTWADNVCQSIE
jgi:hypothetical protein